jgi:membrane protease YdiL (CAAX protease family)
MELEKRFLNPRWSIYEALAILAIIYFSKLAFSVPPINDWLKQIADFIYPSSPTLAHNFVVSIILLVFIFLSIGLLLKYRYHLPWTELGFSKGKDDPWLMAITAIAETFLLFVLIMAVDLIVLQLLFIRTDPQETTQVVTTVHNWWGWVLSFVHLVVIAPLSEELYFRGFLFPALGKLMGQIIPAAIVTSIIFGAFHFDLVRFLPLSVGAFWFNYLYIRTGSIYSSMIAHGVWNFLMLVMVFVFR